jgi:hypothetical protein
MNLTTTSLIELILGLIGIASAASGLAAWGVATQIRHEIGHSIRDLKQESVVLRRRVKLLESFAVKGGFNCLKDSGGDTDL